MDENYCSNIKKILKKKSAKRLSLHELPKKKSGVIVRISELYTFSIVVFFFKSRVGDQENKTKP